MARKQGGMTAQARAALRWFRQPEPRTNRKGRKHRAPKARPPKVVCERVTVQLEGLAFALGMYMDLKPSFEALAASDREEWAGRAAVALRDIRRFYKQVAASRAAE